MRPLGLIWFFMWRMVAWMISCGVAVGVLVAVLIEVLGYAGGGAGEVGGFFGVIPGVLCGIGLAVPTLAFRRLTERTNRYWMIAVAVCAGMVLLPAGILALLASDYEGVGAMFFVPTYFQVFGVPLMISTPFTALGAQKVAKTFSHRANIES